MTPRALKKWRLRLDLSQEGLARWLGVSRSTVNRWEAGTQAIPKMVALVEREHTANQPDPTDTECGCIRGVQACDYHAAGMGGRWRADAEERRVHVGHRRAAGDRRVNRFSPAD